MIKYLSIFIKEFQLQQHKIFRAVNANEDFNPREKELKN